MTDKELVASILDMEEIPAPKFVCDHTCAMSKVEFMQKFMRDMRKG